MPNPSLGFGSVACLELSIRRVAGASLAGAFGGLILFRTSSPIAIPLLAILIEM